MSDPGAPILGTVLRAWRTPTSEGCQLRTEDGPLTLYGPLPPVTPGCTLRAWTEGSTLTRAERVITPYELARAFYSRLRPPQKATALELLPRLGPDPHHTVTQNAPSLPTRVPASIAQALTRHARRESRLYGALQALADLGLPPEHTHALLNQHGAGAPSAFREQPYLAIRHGIPLRVLDHAARLQGLSTFDPRRGPALAYELTRRAALAYGHTCLPLPVLAGELRDSHALDDDEAQQAIEDALNGQLLLEDAQAAFLPEQHRVEAWLADDIARLMASTPARVSVPATPGLTTEQRAAVLLAAGTAVSVITGGPGTGKTTTLRALLDALDAANLRSVLCAPTGKAASRMQQSTGRYATTLHRLLSYDGHKFSSGILPGDVFVVDEVSMASNALLGALLRSVRDGARVILVGDEDQLPPIDPGHPLAALTRTVPTGRLTQTHRQAAGSPILTLAAQLISGESPAQTGVPFVSATSAEDIVQLVLARQGQARPMILTAGRAGPLGVDALNLALQAALNPGDTRLRAGDPILVTRNNHDTGLMNGMTGTVTHAGKHLTCVIEDTEHTFTPGDPTLTLAYAMTIHRSQGSEWPDVIVTLAPEHDRLLSRQLAYTAVTRAKDTLTASGLRAAWTYAAHTGAPRRNSRLEHFLKR
ncbi:AAA family ATPase [Deinococcus sedimenti]|uniref:ATP-dependent RecD-like DNA helicase n=1 Tax=Deinococcus sedimenti TaxID=1867090 RepID=A0ABQ2S8P3_9DEIO|nr:AAA family ATPase [Deinococcus sedimenti]GGS08665.1 ATP-dependent RecD-like DNA helicase [Deinococcus sedimenti]